MTISYRSQTFQETLEELEDKISKNEITSKSQAARYLEDRGIDADDFRLANEEFIDAQRSGEEDFRAMGTGVGGFATRVVGRAAGEIGELVGDVVSLVTPDTIEAKIGEQIPDSWKKAASETFDPYHGTGTQAGIENFTGTMLSYVPVSFKVAGLLGAGVRQVGKSGAGRAINNRILKKYGEEGVKKAQAAKTGATNITAFAATTTAMERPEENVATTLVKSFPELEPYLGKLQVNPNDPVALQYLQSFLINLGLDTILTPVGLAAGIGLKSGAKAAGKTLGAAGSGIRIGLEKGTQQLERIIPYDIRPSDMFKEGNFSSRLGVDEETSQSLLKRQGVPEATIIDSNFKNNQLQNAVKEEYQLDISDNAIRLKINEAIEDINSEAFKSLKPKTKEAVLEMRDTLTGMTKAFSPNFKQDQSIINKIDSLSKKLAAKKKQKAKLNKDTTLSEKEKFKKIGGLDKEISKIRNNITKAEKELSNDFKTIIDEKGDTYVTKSYDYFDDPRFKRNKQNNYAKYRNGKSSDDDDLFIEAKKQLINQYKYTNAEAETYLDKLMNFDKDKGTVRKYNNSSKYQREIAADGDLVIEDLLTRPADTGLTRAKTGEARRNVPTSVQALLGVVDDPGKKFIKSASRLAQIHAETKFLNEIAENLVDKGLAKISPDAIDDGAYLSLNKIAQERLAPIVGEKVAKNNLVTPLENLVFKDKRTRDLYEQALLQGYETVRPDSLPMRFFMNAKGISQKAKTIYSPVTHGRNIMGNLFIMAANGMVPSPGKGWQATKAISQSLKGYNNRELTDLMMELTEKGVISSAVDLGVLRKNLSQFNVKGILGFAKKTNLDKLDNKLTQIYQAEDDFFKIIHYLKSLDTIKKSKTFGKKSLEEQKDAAAQRTRDLMPNYNLTPRFVKDLRGGLLGDFMSFPAEMMRVSKNLAKYSLDDIASGDKALVEAGVKRLGGMTAIGLGGDMLVDYSRNVFGITGDQHEGLMTTSNPWTMNTNSVYLSPIDKDANGHMGVDVMRLGYIDPFEYVKRMARTAHIALASGQEMSNEELNDVMLNGVIQTLSPFLAPTMILGAANEAYQNAQRADFETADLSDAAKIVTPLLEVFEPGFSTTIRKAGLNLPGTDISLIQGQYGQAVEAAKEKGRAMPVKKVSGATWSEGEVDLPAAVGLKRERIDITNDIKYNMRDAVRKTNRAGANLKSELNRNYNFTAEDKPKLYKMFVKEQEKRLNGMEELEYLTNAYRKILGDSYNDEFYRALSEGGYTDNDMQLINAASNNYFVPYIFKETENINQRTQPDLPYQDFYALIEQLYGRKITKREQKK